MSKSLQKGIIFAVCILLVCALGVTLFIFDGTGGAVTGQEGQASAVAKNTATYTHGSNIGRPLPSDYTSVSDGTALKAAIEANNKDIVLTNDVTLQTIDAFWANNYLWNDNSQCFDSDGNGNTNLKVNGFTHKIYGQGYTIEVQGPHAATGEGMQQNGDDTHDYGGLFPKLGNNGAVYDVKIYITKGFSVETYKTWSSWTGSGNDEWMNVGGIAGSLIGNAVIDNVTVEIASGVKLASYKFSDGSSTSQYVRVGAIAGEINNTASISNVTVINNGRLESGQYTSQAKFSPDSDRYYGAAGNVVGWISNATSSINNVRVEGSGTLYSYYVANIANAIGSTVSVNNFYNNFTGTFDAKYKSSNTLGQGEGATPTLTVTNHYKKGALASTAGTDNTVVATNTLTVPNNLTLYFIPKATQDSDRLGIAFSGTTYSSANDYTVTGLNNAEKTARGGFSAAPSGGTLALGLPVGANNWKTDGTFASITATPKFDPSSYAKLTKYEHGYVSSLTTNSGTPITSDNFSTYFAPGGQANNQSGTYYLTEDVVVNGFTGINFSGTFDGNGHTIFIVANNTTSGSAVGGLVGNMTGGTIKNLRVVIYNSVNVGCSSGGNNAIGGLVGKMSGSASLENVQVVIESGATMSTDTTDNHHAMGGVVGEITSSVSLTNVTLQLDGTLAAVGSWTFTGGIVGVVSGGTPTFSNIIIRGNGGFNSTAKNNGQPPYYAAVAVLQRDNTHTSTAATIDGLIYDANFTLSGADNSSSGEGVYSMYGVFSNNYHDNPSIDETTYAGYVTYKNIFYTSTADKITDDFSERYSSSSGNAIVPIGDDTTVKNISANVTGVAGSAVKAYFMPGDSASENLTLVASASNWNGVTQLQLDGAAPAVTSADDGSNKVVNVAKSTAVNISGENLTLSPYNPYTVITASLVTDTKVYDGNPFAAQVSFAVGGSPVSLTDGQYTITYTDGNATGETNANASGGTYSLTVTLKGTASDGTQYVFDAQGTKTKTFTYTITPLEVTGTWSVRGLEITYGDSAPDYDQYISIELTNEGTIPGGLTESNIAAQDFSSNYTSGTRAGETVTITAGTFTVGSGFTASNYNFSGITGSGSLEVQKREITISAAADLEPDAAGHIVVTYGGENYVNSQDSLAALLTWAEIGGFVNGRYGTDEIGFTITQVAHEGDTEAPGTAVDSGEWAKLPANDRYYITVESTNSNYTVAQGNYFTYYIAPAELTIDSVVWSGTNNNTTIYNGSAQTFTVNARGLVEGDNLEDVISTSVTYNNVVHSGNIINAGTYTITVNPAQDPSNYDLLIDVENTYDLTISPIKLTPTDISGTFTEYTSSNLPDGTDFVTSGILESDSEVTVAVTSWVNDPSTNVVGSGNYVAANTYTASLAIQGDTNGNYALSATTAEFEITAYDLSQATITVEASGLVYDGTEKTATVTVKAGEADITDLVTITGNKATKAGDDYTVSISSKDSNTTGSKNADTTWSIAKADYNMDGVTFENDSITYDGESHTLTVSEDSLPTGEDGIKVTVEYTAVNGGEVNITNVGSVDIKATFATESANYNVPEAKTATLTIEKANYDMTGVTFENDSITYDGASHTLTVSGELPTGADDIQVTVTYSAESGDVNITNVGSVKITATFATTSTNYNTPAAKTATLTIEKKAVTIEWSIGDIIQGTDPDKVKDTAKVTNKGGILDGDTYEFTVTLPLKDGSGDYTTTTLAGTVINVTPSLTFTDPTDAGNYNITYSPVTLEWEVQQPEVAISVTAPTVEKTYAAGFVTEADFLSNFTGSFTETSLPAVISADNFDITITKQGESEPTPVEVGRLDVGTYTVTISAAADSQYTIADGSTLTYTYTVTAEQWTATVAAPEGGLTYNGLDQFSSLVITPGEANNSCDGAPTIAAVVTGGEMKNAGTYTVTLQLKTAEGEAYEGGNFVLNSGSEDYSAQIEIAKLKVEIEWEANGDLVYNGQAHTLTATITNKVETDNVTAIVEKHSGDNINVAEGGFSYTITGLENNDLGNYTFEGVSNITSQAFNIIPATLTVEGKEGATLSREYDGNTTAANSFLTADFLTVTGNAPSDDIYAMLNATVAAEKTILNADTYTVTITFNAQAVGASNYSVGDFTSLEIGYTVTAKTITITFDGYEGLTYNGQAHTLTATADFVSGENIDLDSLIAYTGGVTEGRAVNAGSYTATITKAQIEEKNANYTLTAESATQEFTISPATLTLTQAEGASLSKVYDGEVVDPQSLLTPENVTVAGMQNGEDAFELGILSIAAEADSEIKNAAGYKLTVSVKEGNYTAGDLELTYTVTAKLIVVEWSNTEFTYDGAVHKPTATATNLVGDETLTLTVTGEQTNASESPYTATVAKDSVTGNYMLEEDATTEFTIAPKPISVEWSNTTLTYNGSEQKPTAAITDGALIGDDKVEITVEGAQINANTDGAYTATAVITGGDDKVNYTLDSTATTSFTIDPAEIALSLTVSDSSSAPVESPLTWKVSGAVEVAKPAGGWTLTSGDTVYTVTVSGGDDIEGLLDMLTLMLGESEYTGTPYGTKIENGLLNVASVNTNYEVTMTPYVINIIPSLSVTIGDGAKTAEYNRNTTYTADYFASYFSVTTTDGSDAPEGTWEYSVAEIEGEFSDVGKYTITAVYTITEGGAKLQNSFTFEITPASGTATYQGEAFTYGDLKDGDKIAVFVTYNDGFTQTVNATFTAQTSTGGYVIAGETVSLNLTGDDGADHNYSDVSGQIEVKINKYDITANIFFANIASEDGVLTLPYIGQKGYAITAEPVDVLDGDVVELTVNTVITNAQTYTNLGIALLSDAGDSANYNLTGTDTLSVVVTPAEIKVEWSDFDGFTYDGTAKTPTATAKGTFDGDEVTLDVTVTGDNATEEGQAINAGEYTAKVEAFTSGNYKLTEASEQVFTIAKASATLRIDDYNTIMGSAYTGSAVTITPTINGAEDTQGIVVVSITNEAGTPVQEIVNAGKYNVTLSITDNMNYEDASESFEVKVSPASLDVTTANTSFEYGDKIDLGASVTALGDDVVTVAIESVTVDNEAAELKNVGTYTVTYKLEGEDSGNYSIAEGGSVTVTITAKELNIIWSEETFTYNGSAQAPAYTADFIEGEEIELTVTITDNSASEGQAINAGEYTATIAAFEQGNYKLTSDSTKTFTIGKANLTLTPSQVSFSNRDEEMMDKYSESKYEETIKADVTVTGVGNDGEFNEFTIATSATFTEGKLAVGDHTFTISVAGGNYNDATFTVKVTEQEVVTLTATPSSNVYTGSPITFTFGNEVLPEGVEITYTVQKDGEPVESVLDAGNYTVTFTVSNSTDNDKWYEVTEWTDKINPATVTAEDVQAVYGEVFTAAATGEALQRVGGWQIVTFNGKAVEVEVTVTDSAAASAARAGEVYLRAGGYEINIRLVSSNFTFGASPAQTKQLTVARKQLELAPELPSDLTYSSDGIVIGTPDYASQLVGDDAVEVTMLIDGQPYVAGETVLSAGEHTVTFTITDASGNYDVADTSSSTFTVAKKSVTPSINVAGDKVENNSTLEMDKGENMRVETAIDNFIADNGIKEGEYTLSVKDASGADKKLDEIAAWAPGTYTVTVALGDNYDGSLTFSIVVKEGTTAQIPEPPALPSTPLEDSGSSLSTTDWLFPLIIAVECLIAAVLVAAIVIAAIKRSK